RHCRVHLDRLRVPLLAILHGRAVLRRGAGEVPGAVLAADVDARRQRLAGAGIEYLAAQSHRLPLLTPADVVEAAELGLDVVPLVERQPAAQPLRLSGGTVGELWVGVDARARRVVPRAVVWLPRPDHPALAVL